jgi:hypothetical protein
MMATLGWARTAGKLSTRMRCLHCCSQSNVRKKWPDSGWIMLLVIQRTSSDDDMTRTFWVGVAKA